jgi:ribosome maturation factor RimP
MGSPVFFAQFPDSLGNLSSPNPMSIAFIKLPGLDQEKILTLIEPILSRHRLDGVELIWRGDKDGQVLLLTIEKPNSIRTGEGITVDLCSELSREISVGLDESELISAHYRLEVGSPGVERKLYLPDDYRRFAGQEVKLKLVEALDVEGFIGQGTIRGTLYGLDDEGVVTLETDQGNISLPLSNISSARLVFSWNQTKRSSGRPRRQMQNGPKPGTNKRSS